MTGSFFEAELPNDPSSSYKHKEKFEYYQQEDEEEDIGLDYNDNDIAFGIEANEDDNFGDEDDLGLPPSIDDDEIGLAIPLPDDDIFGVKDNSTPAPQDPTVNNDSYALQMNLPFNEFAKEVVYTIASKVTGYSSVHELREDLRKDTGLLPDYVVAHYGFPNFETFMKSDLMSNHIKMVYIDGKHYFLPKNCETFAHIRNEQEIERAATLFNQNREENEKLSRALLPENMESTINGRKLISELLYELGGEEKHVLWQDIQKKYKEKFNEELAGETLKRMFQRDKAIKIIETIFNKEIELFAANLPGQFFLKFKMPYNDLINYYETLLQDNKEANLQKKNALSNAYRTKSFHKPNKVFPVGPLYPTFINPNQSTQDISNKKDDKLTPFGGNKINNDVNNNLNQSNNNLPSSSSDACTKKSKFDITPQEIGISNKKQSIASMLKQHDEDDDIAEESKIKVKYNRTGWAEESSLPAYEIGGQSGGKPSRLDPPSPVQNVDAFKINEEKGVEGGDETSTNNTKNKKTRYTSRVAGQDFTDSDDSCDEDDIVSFKPPPKKESNNEMNKNQTEGSNLTSFVPQQTQPASSNKFGSIFAPQPKLTGHRAEIQKFMQEKVEQRKASGVSTTSATAPSLPQHQPNPIKQRYPITFSSDESDDDIETSNSKKQKNLQNVKSVERVLSNNSVGVEHPEQQQKHGSSLNNSGGNNIIFDSPPSLSLNQQEQEQQQKIINQFPSYSNISINQQQSTQQPSSSSSWLLIDKIEWLRLIANKQKMSNESRPDEGSFVFRKGSEVLVLTESDNKIRASKHFDGKIKWEGYFPKTEWELFSITIHGLLSVMLRELNNQKMAEGNVENIQITSVPMKCKDLDPPYPAYRETIDGQEFLCFFTKKYGFSNHYLDNVEIDGINFCCVEQYYMFTKASYFGFNSIAKEIMLTRDTSLIKKLGNANTMRERQANGSELESRIFDHKEWRKIKRKVMKKALRAKFNQNCFLLNMLLDTGDANILEASPTDLYWGIGCGIDSDEIKIIDKWRGSNQLGQILMDIRKEFKLKCNEVKTNKGLFYKNDSNDYF